jgi:hypothetical protein
VRRKRPTEQESAEAWNDLMHTLRLIWPQEFVLYDLWLALDGVYKSAARYPEWDEAGRILTARLDGRANDHMTVLRLRRLTEVPNAA